MANKKRLIEATADCFDELKKIKTHFAKIIVEGTAGKPYYSILYYDPTKKEYFNGYGSYNIENVFNWLSEWFEIVDTPTVDAVEVVRCKDCRFIIDREDGAHGCYLHFLEDCKPDDFCSYGEGSGND